MGRLQPRLFLGLLSSCLICFRPAYALDPGTAIRQYLHTSWTQEEGNSLPAIQALAQDADGYLVLGTAKGLIRFDGQRFTPWARKSSEELSHADIRFLQSASPGGLWVGANWGVGRLVQGQLVRYPALDQWLGGTPTAISEDHSGRLWVVGGDRTGHGLAAITPNGVIRVYGAADGLSGHEVRTLFGDSRQNLWLATRQGLCLWRPERSADCSRFPRLNVLVMGEGQAGGLIVWDGQSRRMLDISQGKLHPLESRAYRASVDPRLLMRDRDGNLWIGTAGQGLLRLSGSQTERFTRKDGLSSDFINALLEDREGNLWVGTARGIDRFRQPNVFHLSALDGLSSDVTLTVCSTGDGAAWVGTSGGGLDRVAGSRISHYRVDSGLPTTTVISVHQDAAGRLWAASTGGLTYRSLDRFIEVRDPEGAHFTVFAMSDDPEGGVRVADVRKGLFSIRDGVARPMTVAGIQAKDIYRLQTTRDGTLWIGHYRGGLTAVRGRSLRSYGANDGLAAGAVQAIYEDRRGTLWVGTATGLSRLRDGVWTTWNSRLGLPEGGVQSIIEDDLGFLWLMTGRDMLRLPLASLDSFRNGAPVPLSFLLFGLSEGLRLPGASMVNQRLAKSEDGRLWVATEDGIVAIDPRKIHNNPVPPPVAIEQVTVDGRPLEWNSGSDVEFHGGEVQITYTGLSLTAPERVRFRYRLEGVDRNWTEAGALRGVTYVNLSPRKYRFRVLASNNDGVWNTTGATWTFRVVPYFYQAWWFYGLILVAAGIVVWGVHQLRVRSVVARFQLVAQERARLTRELHDSLLQGFSGVLYQLDAASRLFSSNPAAAKERLDRALDQADQSLREGRSTIMSMRLPALENSTLPDAVTAIGKRATEGTSIGFHLDVKGPVRELPYDVQATIYLIGREAVTNAVNHARPEQVTAELVYMPREVRLTVEDDGAGFDLNAGLTKNGHWGIHGMQERAKKIGGTISFQNAADGGTIVQVAVPLKK